MPRRPRSLHVLVLSLVYAALALGATGLHVLPGWSHNAGVRPAARNDHSHGPGRSSLDLEDDCLLCGALHQSSLDTAIGLAVFVAGAEAPTVPRPVSLSPAARPRLASPRAPPLPA